MIDEIEIENERLLSSPSLNTLSKPKLVYTYFKWPNWFQNPYAEEVRQKEPTYRYYSCTADLGCNNAFNELDHLIAHEMAVHNKLPLYKCTECRKRYTTL